MTHMLKVLSCKEMVTTIHLAVLRAHVESMHMQPFTFVKAWDTKQGQVLNSLPPASFVVSRVRRLLGAECHEK